MVCGARVVVVVVVVLVPVLGNLICGKVKLCTKFGYDCGLLCDVCIKHAKMANEMTNFIVPFG